MEQSEAARVDLIFTHENSTTATTTATTTTTTREGGTQSAALLKDILIPWDSETAGEAPRSLPEGSLGNARSPQVRALWDGSKPASAGLRRGVRIAVAERSFSTCPTGP